jgi:hypothetical protein
VDTIWKNSLPFLKGETKEVKVLDVEWNVRKYNYLKPRVKTEPVYFGNVKVQYFSGYNAKYIKDNKKKRFK